MNKFFLKKYYPENLFLKVIMLKFDALLNQILKDALDNERIMQYANLK